MINTKTLAVYLQTLPSITAITGTNIIDGLFVDNPWGIYISVIDQWKAYNDGANVEERQSIRLLLIWQNDTKDSELKELRDIILSELEFKGLTLWGVAINTIQAENVNEIEFWLQKEKLIRLDFSFYYLT